MRALLIALVLGLSSTAFAQTGVNVIPVQSDGLSGTGGLKINDLSIATDACTGWIFVANVREVVLECDWDDVAGNVSEIDMVCYTERTVSSIADGVSGTSGYQVTVNVGTDTTGESEYEQHIWSWDFTDGDTKWEWVITHPRAQYINCCFSDATGTADATDDLTVYARGANP